MKLAGARHAAWLLASVLLGGTSVAVAIVSGGGLVSAGLTCAAGIAAAVFFLRTSRDAAGPTAASTPSAESKPDASFKAHVEELETALLANAQSFSRTGVWEVDMSTGLGTWSEEMYQVCGLDPVSDRRAQPGQEDILKIIHPQDRRKLMLATERSGKDYKPFEVTHRICWPDGTLRPCITRGKVLPPVDGRPPRMVGTTRDLSEEVRMEESLRDSEARFLAFMDHSPFSAWMRDRSGQFVYCNERFAEHMGMQAHEIMGKDQSSTWFSRDYVERSSRDDQRVLESGRSTENIEHVPLRDGSLRHWLVLKFPIQNQSGERLVGGVALDLTGRYEAEEKLRASEKRLRSIMQSASEGIAVTDREGKIISWNRAAENIFGRTAEEVTGSPLTAFLSEAGKQEYVAQIADLPADTRAFVVRGLRKNGEEFALELSHSSWQSGAQTFYTKILRDVTERHAIEEQLRLSEAQMRITLDAALDAVPQIVWTAGPDGKLSYFNRKWFDYAGVSFPLVSAQGWLDWVHPDDLAATSAVWQKALRDGEACEMEYRLRRGADGSHRWHLGRALPVRDSEGRVLQWFGTSTDIHDHKMVQEEQALLRAREAAAVETSRLKSEFLAHMSHEIRTPINGVIGMSDLLMDTRLDRDQLSYADAIQRSAKGLLDILNDILDFSKIEAGKLEIEQIDFDLARTFEDTGKMLHFQARAKNLELTFEIARDVFTGLRGDPGRLRQVLGNLISNAVKFTASGRIQVKATREDSPVAGEKRVRLLFEVTDTGIGISESAMERMFQPFSQADSSTSRHFGGTGLGLSICKRLVVRMGGEIGVRSRVGAGSTFWFIMPFELGTRALAAPGISGGPVAVPKWGSATRLLVAEDNAINQTILLKQLEKRGLSADAVSNGQEVLAAVAARSYDLILMDCQMPGMDGYEATSRIRSSQGASYQSIPIVAVTANAIQGDREKCLNLGMNDYLSKPVNSGELGRVLAQWLKPSLGNAKMQQESVIELKMIEELRSLDDGQGDVLRQLVEMFVGGGGPRIATITKAHAEGDLKTLNNEAHSLKSSAGNLGAHQMAALCLKLEHAQTPEAAAAVAEVPAQLRAEFEKASAALKALVSGEGSAA